MKNSAYRYDILNFKASPTSTFLHPVRIVEFAKSIYLNCYLPFVSEFSVLVTFSLIHTDVKFIVCYFDNLMGLSSIKDHCATRNCSDICVNEGDKATCLCRDGFHLTGGSACVGNVSDENENYEGGRKVSGKMSCHYSYETFTKET